MTKSSICLWRRRLIEIVVDGVGIGAILSLQSPMGSFPKLVDLAGGSAVPGCIADSDEDHSKG